MRGHPFWGGLFSSAGSKVFHLFPRNFVCVERVKERFELGRFSEEHAFESRSRIFVLEAWGAGEATLVLEVREEFCQKRLVEMGRVQAGEDLGVAGEKFGESSQDFGVVGFGSKALSLVGGRVDDDEVVGCSTDEASPGLEEVVGEVARSLADFVLEVELVIAATGGKRTARHIEVNHLLGAPRDSRY